MESKCPEYTYACAGWYESAHFVHAQRHFFTWRGLYVTGLLRYIILIFFGFYDIVSEDNCKLTGTSECELSFLIKTYMEILNWTPTGDTKLWGKKLWLSFIFPLSLMINTDMQWYNKSSKQISEDRTSAWLKLFIRKINTDMFKFWPKIF